VSELDDSALALAEARRGQVSRGWIVPLIIGSALLMQTLNANVLSNALPTMARSLHEDPIRLNTAITVYLLASAVFLPVSTWAADKFGARRIFVLAMALYALSSAACGLAQDLSQLIGARLLQGVAAAMMTPVGRLVLLRTTPKHELIGALSVLTMPPLLGPALGPIFGGFVVTYWDWRWIFYVNLPIAAAGILLVLRYVPNVKEQTVSPLDTWGVILTGFGLAGLIFGFENLGRGSMPGAAVAALFAGSALCLVIYWRRARGDPHAILDLGLFRIRTFTASVVGGGFMRLAMGAMPFLLALLLQVIFGMSPFEAGLLTCMAAIGSLAMKQAAPPILRRFGFRTVLSVNAVITGVMFLLYAIFEPTTPRWLIMLVLLTGGFFRSLQLTSLNSLAFADIDQPQMSRASAMSTMGQQLVQSIGVGLAATLLHTFMILHGETQLTAAAVGDTFLVLGGVSFVSILFFLALPRDAGEGMHRR
jgi:EmrB/QacA subfamily drug resistance transporter